MLQNSLLWLQERQYLLVVGLVLLFFAAMYMGFLPSGQLTAIEGDVQSPWPGLGEK